MANRTYPSTKSNFFHGTIRQNPFEQDLRLKIYLNSYWKEQCYGLDVLALVDEAMKPNHLGGTYGCNRNPTPFLCLVLKMFHIHLGKGIVVEFIKNESYKYVRVLGAFYMRLIGSSIDIYQYLEPLYSDYRKLRMKMTNGKFRLTHVDVVIDELLTNDYFYGIALPPVLNRLTLEIAGLLETRRSVLDCFLEEEEEKEEDDLHAIDTEKASELGEPSRSAVEDVSEEEELHARDIEQNYHYGRTAGRDRDGKKPGDS